MFYVRDDTLYCCGRLLYQTEEKNVVKAILYVLATVDLLAARVFFM
jgi:hypothetical protein